MENPRKTLLNNLKGLTVPASVWIQGTVEQTVGCDIIILSDGTGKAKITHCSTADGKATCKGVYCCIIGTMISTRGLPEIHATKIVDLSQQPVAATMWHTEVKEADLFLNNLIKPII